MSKYPGKIVTALANTGNSVAFDGTGDYLSVANNAALQFGSGDFTIEFWWYPNVTSDQNLISKWNSSTEWILQWRSAGNFRWAANGSVVRDANYTLSAGAWIHVAVSCASTNLRIFVNGAQIGTTATQSSITNTSEAVTIGAGQISSTPLAVNGYISNVRIIKGTALYTAAFTPPTQLLNVTNTVLLTCNSPAIIDQSSNAFTITANGNAAVSTLTPFTAYVPYNPALGASTPGVWTVDEAMQAAATRQWNMYDPYFNLTTLLLHGNGTNGAQNNTFLDSSTNNFTITRNGNTTQGSYSPFSQTGWSNGFSVSGTYLTATQSAFAAASDFTVEAWFWQNNQTSGFQGIVSTSTSGNSSGFRITTDNGTLTLWVNNSSVTSASVPQNQWNHVAISRTGTSTNNISCYLNGVRVGQFTNTSSTTNTTLTVGRYYYDIANYYIDGYISNVRLVVGSGLYSGAAISVPTTPLTAVSGTQVLTCQSNRFIDSSSNAFALTVNGTLSVQPFSPFLPTRAYTPQTIGGSGYFDGVNDYLRVGGTVGIANSAFAICLWFYPLSSNVAGLFDSGSGQVGVFRNFPSNVIQDQANTGASVNFAGAFQVRAWNWMCITKSGTSFTVRINGATVGTGTCSATLTETALDIGVINSGADGDYDGYISDFQVLNTATVVPVPTAPLTTPTGRTLLLSFTNAGITDATAKNDLETVGNAQISTTQSKFGGSSIFFNGTTDKLITTRSPLFNFGASDFTVEGWLYTGSSATMLPLYSMLNGAKTDTFALQISSGGILVAYVSALGGGTWSLLNASTIGTLTLNAWNHFALVRNGSTWNGYVNGVRGSGFPVTSSSSIAAVDGFTIGEAAGAGFWYSGYIDELRFTRFARYTGAFTPQTSQWQDQ